MRHPKSILQDLTDIWVKLQQLENRIHLIEIEITEINLLIEKLKENIVENNKRIDIIELGDTFEGTTDQKR